MDETHQVITESKLIATEDKLSHLPLSPLDQKKPDRQRKDRKKAKLYLIVVGISAAFVGVIVLIYGWFRFNWPLWILVSLMLIGILLLILFIRTVYSTQWAGFRGYDKITKEFTPGQPTKTIKEHQPGKTFWDWLQLLIIPIILAGATIGFGLWQAHLADLQHQTDQFLAQQQHESDKKLAQLQHEDDQQSALDQQRQATLVTYQANMKDLLLNRGLLTSKQDDEVRVIARTETFAAMRQLDGKRNDLLVQFLQDAHLIGYQSGNIVSFLDADLSSTDLSNADLHDAIFINAILTNDILPNADLNSANLTGAHLDYADLTYAILTNADLNSANLTGADFSGATLSKATLRGATLSKANLSDADLSDADLINADLINANLRGANLRGANLRGAILRYADLNSANLTGVQNLTQQQLDQVDSCKNTTLPPGLACHSNQ